MSSDPNSPDFDYNDYIFDNAKPAPRIVSLQSKKRPGYTPRIRGWDCGELRKATRTNLEKGEVREVNRYEDLTWADLMDCSSDLHM